MFPLSENMNKMYGFEGEVKAKYSANMCELFTEVYNWLPLCHLLNHKVEIITESVEKIWNKMIKNYIVYLEGIWML